MAKRKKWESKGEHKIRNYLIEQNLKYNLQKKFDDCKNVRPLPFDFYIPKYKTLIEFNGIQHYEPISHFGGEEQLRIQKKNDAIKKKFAKENGFDFIEISYEKENDIVKILDAYFKKKT